MTRCAASIVLAAAMVVGCRSKQKPAEPTPPAQRSPWTQSADERMSDAQKRSGELAEVARQLPGRTPEDDRELVAAAFDRAQAALELLGGPNPHGAFRQALVIVDGSRQRLAAGSSGSAFDATVDSGLRAIYNALVSVRDRAFREDQNVQQKLDALHRRVVELDTVRGPLHTLVVAHAFRAASDVIDEMAGEPEPPPTPPTPPAPPAPPSPPIAPVAPAPPQPPVAPAPPPPPAAPEPPLPPAAPVAPVAPSAEQYEQLQRELERLRQENERLRQQQQQSPPPAPPPQ